MKKSHKIDTNKNSNAFWWLLITASVTTLYFNSKIQDPFNAPKMWILMIAASWLSGHVIARKDVFFKSVQGKTVLAVSVFFVVSFIFSSIVTDNKYNAIFGENQRRNGLLTYLSLVIFLLSAIVLINLTNLKYLYLVGFFTGSIMAIYGLMQTFGIDFIKWNNPYNSVISTVGNPNFAAAIMAVFGSLIFAGIFVKDSNKFVRLLSGLFVIVLTFAIFRSDARQGLVSIVLGISVVVLVWLYQLNKILGRVGLFIALITGFFGILGMLQIGPLSSFLYKGSVTVRGYYWSAGLEMFKNNFWTGVGIDRFGSYFKEFRDVQYPLKYGFEITSSNAHNVPIQMFATGGVFLGLSYLMILSLVAWRGIVLIRKTTDTNKLLAAGLVGSWLAFQAQSLISIDNIGISIWGWLLSGSIIGASLQDEILNNKVNNTSGSLNVRNFKNFQPLISGSLLLITVVLVSFLYKGESSMFQTRGKFNPADVSLNESLRNSALETINTPLVEPSYKISSGAYLVTTGYSKEGIELLTKLHSEDPRNLDTLSLLADFSQQLGNLDVSNSYRLKIVKLDPWNAKNYLQLGRNYKSLGQFTLMSEMRTKILSFAPSTEEAKQAISELN
jgi:O-antigen ligase